MNIPNRTTEDLLRASNKTRDQVDFNDMCATCGVPRGIHMLYHQFIPLNGIGAKSNRLPPKFPENVFKDFLEKRK